MLLNCFEVGIGNIVDVVGFGVVFDYVNCVGIENIVCYEYDLFVYVMSVFVLVLGVWFVGIVCDKVSVLLFVLKGYEIEEVG